MYHMYHMSYTIHHTSHNDITYVNTSPASHISYHIPSAYLVESTLLAWAIHVREAAQNLMI